MNTNKTAFSHVRILVDWISLGKYRVSKKRECLLSEPKHLTLLGIVSVSLYVIVFAESPSLRDATYDRRRVNPLGKSFKFSTLKSSMLNVSNFQNIFQTCVLRKTELAYYEKTNKCWRVDTLIIALTRAIKNLSIASFIHIKKIININQNVEPQRVTLLPNLIDTNGEKISVRYLKNDISKNPLASKRHGAPTPSRGRNRTHPTAHRQKHQKSNIFPAVCRWRTYRRCRMTRVTRHP